MIQKYKSNEFEVDSAEANKISVSEYSTYIHHSILMFLAVHIKTKQERN